MTSPTPPLSKVSGTRRAELKYDSGRWTWPSCARAVEAAVVSQPGVIHIEAHWPQGTAFCIYDGSQTSATDVVARIRERAGRAFSVVADGPTA